MRKPPRRKCRQHIPSRIVWAGIFKPSRTVHFFRQPPALAFRPPRMAQTIFVSYVTEIVHFLLRGIEAPCVVSLSRTRQRYCVFKCVDGRGCAGRDAAFARVYRGLSRSRRHHFALFSTGTLPVRTRSIGEQSQAGTRHSLHHHFEADSEWCTSHRPVTGSGFTRSVALIVPGTAKTTLPPLLTSSATFRIPSWRPASGAQGS